MSQDKKTYDQELSDLNTRMCHITGTVTGQYDRKQDKGVIRVGKDSHGLKHQIFEIEVSKKNRETGKWTNGKNMKVTLFGPGEDVEIGDQIGLGQCYLEPDNYTDPRGREIRGVGIVAYTDNLFNPKSWKED